MTIETELERAIFFDADEFAVACEYTRTGQTSAEAPIFGIFDSEFLSVSLEGNMEVASTDPVFQCSTTCLPTAKAPGDTLKINDVTYTARVFRPDGTGITTVVLEGP